MIGSTSNNAFAISPSGTITQIIGADGDGAGNPLTRPYNITVDDAGNVYVSGYFSHNAFRISIDTVPSLSPLGLVGMVSCLALAGGVLQRYRAGAHPRRRSLEQLC